MHVRRSKAFESKLLLAYHKYTEIVTQLYYRKLEVPTYQAP